MATPEPPVPDVPRVLLFGHRGSGKSALLGALFRAGETQGEILRGEVVSPSEELPRLRDAAYRGQLESAATELTSYTIRMRPWRVGSQPLMDPLTVILDDCDGKAAEALLAHPDPITQRAPGSPLARAVVETDAIMLLVNASSSPAELDDAFTEFDAFLTTVRRAKTDARAVGGFPVFLVLTQCDRLLLPGDNQTKWQARVTDRVDYAGKKFAAYLKEASAEDDGPAEPFLSFGSVDLDVSAVAIRRPMLDKLPPPGDEPYQVAELFRDCFAGAKAHHERLRRSERRLWWTVRVAIAGLSFLFLAFGMIALFPPEATGPDLAAKVDDYRNQEKPAAKRLASGERERNRSTLARFAGDSAFSRLSEERRQFVQSRLKEIEDYEAYRGRLASAVAPASVRSVKDAPATVPDLASVRKALLTDLALPAEYSWGETAAAELRDKWLADCTALEAATQALVDWYRANARAGTALTLKRNFDAGWLKDIDALFATAEHPPFPRHEPVPGSTAVNQPRGEAVTYDIAFEFDEVYQARRLWEDAQKQLVELSDLADALGATGPNRPEPVLVLPEPNGIDSAALPAARLAALARVYPRQSAPDAEWKARGELVGRVQKSFDTGTRHVHKLMKVQDHVEGWTALGATLSEQKFRDWGRLLHLLARLQDPTEPDPVTELAAFLRDLDKRTFELDMAGFELTIPLNLMFDRVEPTGSFTVTVRHADQSSEVAKFNVGKGVTRDTNTVYALTPDGNAKLAYRAGDSLRAELPVKAGAHELKLIWETGSTNTFQFDRLSREPRLTKPPSGTEPATGVRLALTAGSVPKLPVLFPLR